LEEVFGHGADDLAVEVEIVGVDQLRLGDARGPGYAVHHPGSACAQR
jgi:hypothetical protein